MEDNKRSLVAKFANRFNLESGNLLATLKATAFRQRDGSVPSNEQMAALLVVADQYDLNPFTREIFAFQDREGIVPVVSVDGWTRIINSHPNLDGIEFRWSEDMTTPPGGKPCPEWCEVLIYRKDRNRPTVVREYLDEVYRPPFKGQKQGRAFEVSGPWQTHTKRMLRHKALIQGSRVGFGFAGIYDEDEAKRIIEANPIPAEDITPAQQAPDVKAKGVAGLKARLAQKTPDPAPFDHVEPEGETVEVEVEREPGSDDDQGAAADEWLDQYEQAEGGAR